MIALNKSIGGVPIVSRVLVSVTISRVHNMREEQTREKQIKHYTNHRFADQIFTLQQLLQQRFAFQRLTITVHLDIRAASEIVDRFPLWHWSLRNEVRENYLLLPKELYSQVPGLTVICSQPLPTLFISSGVRKKLSCISISL